MIFLREITTNINRKQAIEFPFSVAAQKVATTLSFTSAVTFFVGENGAGKSTLLEAIGAALDLPTIGSESFGDDSTLADARRLARCLRLVWNTKTRKGFFLRTEDFFNFSRKIATMVQELADEAKGYEEDLSGYGLKLATGSTLAQREALISKYGKDLDANSHGEAIMHLLQQRLVPNGIYLLDEPETPFSPTRQLALLSLIKRMSAEENCQFIIATHSPIMLALPGATIYNFDCSPMSTARFDELEHVNLTRDFLNNPQAFLKHL